MLVYPIMAGLERKEGMSLQQQQKCKRRNFFSKGIQRCERCDLRGPQGRRRHIGESHDTDHLMIRTRSLFQGGPSALETPDVMGSFSLDSENNIHFDNSMMPLIRKEYIPSEDKCMQVELNLNKNLQGVNGYTGTTAKSFNQFLHWIIENQSELLAEDSSNKLMADFICMRGILKTIMHAPYERRSDKTEVAILAQYFKGSVYMTFHYEEFEGIRKKEDPPIYETYGHKFEQYITGGDPDEVLECNCQFRCVMRQHLNEWSLLYTVSIDAVDETLYHPDFKDLSSIVKLKACKERNCNIRSYKFGNVLNEWWNENQLSGVPRLLMGIHKDGIVHTLQMMETAKIPDMAEKAWEPSVSINFLVKFLHFVKEKVFCEPHRVHCFQRSEFLCHIRHFHAASGTDILPEWYKMQLFNEDNTD